MSRIDCLRMGSEGMVINILSLEAIEIHCFTFIFIHNTTVVYSRSYSDQFIVYSRGPQTFFCEGHIIFPCLMGGRVGLWQKITWAGVTSIIVKILI